MACAVTQAAGHHTGNVIVVDLGAAFKGGQGAGGSVGDDVTPQAINFQLTAHLGDLQAQIRVHLHAAKALLGGHHLFL